MFPPLRPPSWQLAGRIAAARNFLTAHCGPLVCALFLLAGLGAAGDYGMIYDEDVLRRIAASNVEYILGQTDQIEGDFYSDRVHSVSFELLLLLTERALGLEDYHYIHRLRLILTHLFFILGGYFCYRLVYQLFGSRLLALFALLLYLLHPRLYGHSFFNSKDPIFLSMFMVALYLLERAFRRDTPGAFVLLGVGVGLLMDLRIMGIMLFPAVIAMRGLDWLQGGAGQRRKHILLTAGLFLLTGALTAYALLPYAWTNPVDYLTTRLNMTVNHHVVWPQLFQGEWYFSDQLPPQYNAVWFGITTPPLILLLGGLGAAAGAIAALRRPGAAFRNTQLRFLLLPLACFLLPPLAAALFSSNQYNDWRHLYFLYAPFCLLAAAGLGWLAAGLARWRPGRAGMYGLTGLGLGLVLLQITQLHPLQHLYFNFLVDRTTGDYLRTNYHFSYEELAHWAALRQILKKYPGETLALRVYREWDWELDWELLPPADRERLPLPDRNDRADYDLIDPIGPGQADLAFNGAYRRIYNNTVTALRPLDAARMTPAAIAAYQEIYRQAVAGEPIIRADYNVYLKERRLTFVQENCPPDSPDAGFGVRLFPPPGALSPLLRRTDFYVDRNLTNRQVRLGEVCLAVLQLPDYVQGDIILYQVNLGRTGPRGVALWERFYSLTPPGFWERINRLREGLPPAAPEVFEVFLEPAAGGRYRLLYAKGDCPRDEYKTPVFLRLYSDNLADSPFYVWAEGLERRDFRLAAFDGGCLADYPLPNYPIAAILTGQGRVWEKNLYPPADPEPLRATYAALAAGQPAARSDFDLYVQDSRLIYLREICAAADTTAKVFLHIVPEDVADLPAARQRAGFANRDFDFARWGGFFDGKCLTAVPLPDYPIAAIRTGQEGVWSVNFPPPVAPGLLRAAAAALSDYSPDLRADFDLYLRDRQLIYLRETCAAADTAAGFFLHIIPVAAAVLPAEQQAAGFANMDFVFNRWGGPFDGKCLATVPLPDYPIKSLRTGQYIPGQGEVWAAELTIER